MYRILSQTAIRGCILYITAVSAGLVQNTRITRGFCSAVGAFSQPLRLASVLHNAVSTVPRYAKVESSFVISLMSAFSTYASEDCARRKR